MKLRRASENEKEKEKEKEVRRLGTLEVAVPSGAAVYAIAPERIEPNPSQPRRLFSEESILSLAASIRRYGLIQPVVVRRSDSGKDGSYELVEGERRLRAARLLGLKEVPCLIIRADSRRSAELALTENLQREPLTAFDEAAALTSFMTIYSLTPEDMAERLGTSPEEVRAKLDLLRLSPEERAAVITGGLSRRHCAALLKLNDVEKRRALLRRAVAEGLSAEQVEAACTEEKPQGKSVCVMHDVRAFLNTVDRAVDLMRRAGVDIKVEKADRDRETELLIRIPTVPAP